MFILTKDNRIIETNKIVFGYVGIYIDEEGDSKFYPHMEINYISDTIIAAESDTITGKTDEEVESYIPSIDDYNNSILKELNKHGIYPETY